MLLPLRWINRTVSALYSAENVRRFRSFSTVHSYRAYFRAFRSVHQTGASPVPEFRRATEGGGGKPDLHLKGER
jgi:hypothetical protein